MDCHAAAFAANDERRSSGRTPPERTPSPWHPAQLREKIRIPVSICSGVPNEGGGATGLGSSRLSAGRLALPSSANVRTRLMLIRSLLFLASSPSSSGYTPPHPATMETYCLPCTEYVIGEAIIPLWAGKLHSFWPLVAS